jgi:3-phenylpropionate/trans-cinnamate dioxygenase ferredoxin subunit
MAEYVKVAKTSDIPQHGGKCVEAEGRRLAVFHADDGSFYAIDDMCTHEDGPLSDGDLDGDEVICPWHMATFNIKTGKCTGPPADEDVTPYNVRVNGEDIEVEV